jgi:hypothetical protein
MVKNSNNGKAVHIQFYTWYIYTSNYETQYLQLPTLMIYSTYFGEMYQVNFERDDDEVRFVLDQHAELDFYSASSLKQQFADRYVAPLGHIIELHF